MTADAPSERKPARNTSKQDNSWSPMTNERLTKIVCSLGAAFACGFAETAGRHLNDIAVILAQNPLPTSGVGGAAFGAAVMSRRGRNAIAKALRFLVHVLEGRE